MEARVDNRQFLMYVQWIFKDFHGVEVQNLINNNMIV